jgi:hypothetical protein
MAQTFGRVRSSPRHGSFHENARCGQSSLPIGAADHDRFGSRSLNFFDCANLKIPATNTGQVQEDTEQHTVDKPATLRELV